MLTSVYGTAGGDGDRIASGVGAHKSYLSKVLAVRCARLTTSGKPMDE
jgi:hypothetical protein